MNDLDDLVRELSEPGPLTRTELLRVVQAVAQTLDQVLQNRKVITDTVQFVQALEDRLLIVDALPVDAPFGALIRRNTGGIGQQAPLYLGNGPGQPLSKLVPVAL